MKTIKDVQKYIGGEIKNKFAYGIDKNRSFIELVLTEEPTIEQLETLKENGFFVHKNISHKVVDDSIIPTVVFEVQHRDLKDIEFV